MNNGFKVLRQIERNQTVRGEMTGDIHRKTWIHCTESALDLVRWVHVAPLTEVSSGYIFDKNEMDQNPFCYDFKYREQSHRLYHDRNIDPLHE